MNKETILYKYDVLHKEEIQDAMRWCENEDFENLTSIEGMAFYELFRHTGYGSGSIRDKVEFMHSLNHAFYDDGDYAMLTIDVEHTFYTMGIINSSINIIVPIEHGDLNVEKVTQYAIASNHILKEATIISVNYYKCRFCEVGLKFLADLDPLRREYIEAMRKADESDVWQDLLDAKLIEDKATGAFIEYVKVEHEKIEKIEADWESRKASGSSL